MDCESLEGIPLGCSNNIGGVRKFYLAKKSDVLSLTLNSPDGEIDAINMSGSPPVTFVEFEFTKGSAFYEENTETNDETGVELTTQTITLNLNRREKTKRDKIALAGRFQDLVAIVEDNNGVIWLFGQENGVNLKTRTGGSGAKKPDKNGYTLTFVGEEPEEANTVTESALAAVI